MYLFFAIIGFIVNIILSNAFAGLAEDKGYDRNKYFWLWFVFGIIGYAWIGALPDANLQFKVSQFERYIRNNDTTSNDSTPLQNGNWKCKCGKQNAAYVTTCVCGTSKRDL